MHCRRASIRYMFSERASIPQSGWPACKCAIDEHVVFHWLLTWMTDDDTCFVTTPHWQKVMMPHLPPVHECKCTFFDIHWGPPIEMNGECDVKMMTMLDMPISCASLALAACLADAWSSSWHDGYVGDDLRGTRLAAVPVRFRHDDLFAKWCICLLFGARRDCFVATSTVAVAMNKCLPA